MDSVDLSIIIVNWNTRDYLRACLESIYKHPPHKYTFEVIVVDNASRDGSVDMVRQEFPQVRLIANDYNYGFAKATNQGYRISRGRYVMSLNPDTEVFEGSLESMVEFLENHPNVGMVVPGIVGGDGNFYIPADKDGMSKFVPPFILQRIFLNIRGLARGRNEEPTYGPREARIIWGTGIVARREVLDHDKFFSERAFMFGEEHWLCFEVLEKGYKLFALPAVLLRHIRGGSWRSRPEFAFMATLMRTSADYLVRKHVFGFWNAQVHALLGFLNAMAMWLALQLKYLFRRHPLSEVVTAEWAARVRGNFGVLVRGEDFCRKVNREVEDFFNKVTFIS